MELNISVVLSWHLTGVMICVFKKEKCKTYSFVFVR
jgi:hypothetical protein